MGGPHTASNELKGFLVPFFAFFPMWYVFTSVPVPIGMVGDGLFWGLIIVAVWHFVSIIARRLARHR